MDVRNDAHLPEGHQARRQEQDRAAIIEIGHVGDHEMKHDQSSNTGGEGPWNQWKHLGNIEGTGSICLRCFHQTQFDYIWNVTITCT